MTKIGTSGHHGAGNSEAGEAGHPQAGAFRSRSEDRPKGMGDRQAALGQGTGRDPQASTSHHDDARADAFSRSLGDALSRGGEPVGRDDGHPQRGAHGSDEEISALLAGLSAQPAALTPRTPPAASHRHEAAAVGGRPTSLKSLWAHEPDLQDRVAQTAAAVPSGATTSDRPTAGAGADKPKRVLHLLAEADPAAAAPAPLQPATLPPRAAEGAATGPSNAVATTAERVEQVAERVSQAIRSEDAPAAGQTIKLTIPLDAASHAQSLTVAVSATAVDVTLARDAGSASSDLAGAATALADRLQRRFPNRTVRIYDAVRPSALGVARAIAATRIMPEPESEDS